MFDWRPKDTGKATPILGRPTRRLLLQTAAATAATAMLAGRGRATVGGELSLWTPAAGWGTFGKPRRILEIYLRGAASMWNSFWYDAALGGTTTPAAGVAAGTGDVALSNADWQAITNGTVPAKNMWNGFWVGSAAGPLFRGYSNPAGGANRKLADYMRILRVGHDVSAHEVAIPYATTGTTLGRAKASGLGAACFRRRVEYLARNGLAPIPGPKTLIFQTGSQSGDALAANSSALYGFHGAQYRPPIVQVGNTDFYDALNRADPVLDRTDTDPLKKFFRDRYGSHMMIGAAQARSTGWSAYQTSFDTLINDYAALRTLLGSQYSLLFPAAAPITYYNNNLTRGAIKAAINLLKDPANELMHIAVIDGGVESDYDTHTPPLGTTAAKIQNGNIWNVCDVLAGRINDILDNGIAVLIHSEFGRIESGSGVTGTEHHTPGYANVVISDMVVPGFSGSKKAGVAGEATYTLPSGATSRLTPTDVHAAVAQLAGIRPWQDDMYDADLAGTTDAGAPDHQVGTHLLGI